MSYRSLDGGAVRRLSVTAALMLAVLVPLNAMLILHLWLPDFTLRGLLRPTPEFLVVVLASYLTGRAGGRRRRFLFAFTVVLACVVFFFSLGEMITRYLYFRDFRPGEDLAFFPEFIRLLFTAESDARLLAYTTLFALSMAVPLFLQGESCEKTRHTALHHRVLRLHHLHEKRAEGDSRSPLR